MRTPLASASFAAIGTTASVVVGNPAALAEAVAVTRAHVETLDRTASRFRDDSELSRVNAAAGSTTAVSPPLFESMEEALGAAASTGGVVDPTVGKALEFCGYDRDFADVSPDGPPLGVRYRRVGGWRAVRLDRAARTVTVPRGVRMDLGATAKAGCADRAAADAAGLTGSGVLVNLGGDIAVSGPVPEGGWPIRVTDRHDAPPTAPGVHVAIVAGGMATSGTAARRWARGGRTMHHLIDPSTGEPAPEYWRTVTVAAATCLEANTASTAAVILGPAALSWLAGRGVHARLVASTGAVSVVGDWPGDARQPDVATRGAAAP